MIRFFLAILFSLILLTGCSSSDSSYTEGQSVAEELYGSMDPQTMVQDMAAMGGKIRSQLESADDKQAWWNGFCDRGEEIWIARVDEMNQSMGMQILNDAQIKSMFDQMRASFQE